MKAPILSPSFTWFPAATHGTSEAFRARQKAREAAAKAEREANATEARVKVAPMTKRKA